MKRPLSEAFMATRGNAEQLRGKGFQPGQSGNPGGKPRGARNRINARFLNELEKDFEEVGEDGYQNGVRAIRECRTKDPSAYVRALLALQPKELEITKSPFAELSDEQLESIFAACGAILSAQSHSPGDGEAACGEPASGLSTVHEAG